MNKFEVKYIYNYWKYINIKCIFFIFNYNYYSYNFLNKYINFYFKLKSINKLNTKFNNLIILYKKNFFYI